MQFSERISRISVSTTTAVVAKADKLKASGIDVVDFGAGEPDFPTPDNVKRAAIKALQENFTKYTPTGGIRDLKQAIVERHAQDFGSEYIPEECLVTVGGKQAIFEAVAATLNHGDEAILAGADIVTVPPKFFPQMCAHPKTDEAVQQFIRDFREWTDEGLPSAERLLVPGALIR